MTRSFEDWDSARTPSLQEVFDALPPMMEQRPFGRNADGEPLDLATGTAIVPFVEHTLRLVADGELEAAGPRSIAEEAEFRARSRTATLDELISRLNATIEDPDYWITEERLLNTRSRYSVEFDEYLSKCCFELTGRDHEFHLRAADECFPEAVTALTRPLSLRQAYIQFTHTARWSHAEVMYAEPAGPNSMVIKWSSNNVAPICSETVWRSYTRSTCDYLSSLLAAIPREHSGLDPARFTERSCQLHGADFCTWEFTWEGASTRRFAYVWAGLAASIALVIWMAIGGAGASIITWIALVPALVGVILTQYLTHRAERDIREAMLTEQHEIAEQSIDRNLRSNVEMQRVHHDLLERHREIEAMHGMADTLGNLIDRESLLKGALKQVVDELGFDRAALLLVDSAGRVLEHAAASHPDFDPIPFSQPIVHNGEGPRHDIIELLAAREPMEFHADSPTFADDYAWLKGVDDWVGVPLIGSENRLRIGVLIADKRISGRPISSTDGPVLASAATKIADAVLAARDYGRRLAEAMGTDAPSAPEPD